MSTDLERPRQLLNPASGELVPATPENAAVTLRTLRDLEAQVREAKRVCSEILAEEATRQGTRTLRFGALTASVRAPEFDWDHVALRTDLERAGCPQERIDALIRTEISYRVDGNVARQLATNPSYKTAIERAKILKQRAPYVTV